MSRSRKKEPIAKDPSNSQGKRFASRKYRRSIKQSIYHEKEIMPLEKEVTNTWELVDFKSNGHTPRYSGDPEKLKRK